MADPFLAEIRVFSFNFAPQGWATCSGQLLPINQNQALFALLGTQYGGNGQTNFALPNLQGRVPVHRGQGLTQGQAGGETAHTLSIQELPAHAHLIKAANPDDPSTNVNQAVGNYFSNSRPSELYNTFGSGGTETPGAGTITNTGGSQPHNNMAPYLVLNFCIALQGIFPSPN